MKKKIACPECERGWYLACNNTGVVNGDPGMRKVVNLATNYMSALCETGASPGRFDRFPAVYYRAVSTRDWNVKLGPHVIGNHLDTSAYIEDLDGFF